MSARQVILEERFARLEEEVRVGPATSAGSFHALLDELSASFERIINEQTNHELIVFGLPKVSSENCPETITKISSSFNISVFIGDCADFQDFWQEFILVSTYSQIYDNSEVQ